MRRRNPSAWISVILVYVLIPLLILYLIILVIKPLVALFVAVAVIFSVVAYFKRKGRARNRAWESVCAIINQKLNDLSRRRAQLIRYDPYGKMLLDRWIKEIDYFIDHHIFPVLTPEDYNVLRSRRAQIVGLIVKRTDAQAQQEPALKAFSDRMTPTEFEAFCAEQLRTNGWNAQVTMRSRDQGVDVIAEKAGKRVVLQCKLYAGTVGNSAVQEIAAGRAHERAHYGAVVTNSRYSAPAEQLASTNGVLLLHYTDLTKLDDLLTLRFSYNSA
jgi:hypothetical protein